MAKHLNVNLAFTADTSQAKKNITELQASLNEISSMKPQFGMSLTQDMKEAVSSAKALQGHLNNAFNTKTGNLDLNKLNASLKNAGTDLATLSSGLLRAGQSGEQAFMNIQRSVATASVQIKQANGLLASFWTTMKNTARWQFSSSILHGFMGAIQSAYGYAQDLDASLNNIRIVTGYNTDAMAAFAEQANKAAKALSTTTTNYTDASLIFYQQGLKGKDVTDRADTVIKMANVTGEAAADVSDYMTAVWNNFYDGSKSLEYYADVMTALGAATASSTDEIAAGLEKFSAVADTVGLSYEYATAALATVTAETRQSADVVGTAFKTIFARIQGLSLGETLEDGVDLNKYSQALAKVGVDVLDATGQLKDADIILSDMAATWENLSKAQQVALAQAVGGVRQYNQIISLMDNWDVMEENLKTVGASEGSLQNQADIYEESWAAASKRVKASLEGLYNDLIPTDFIIEMTNGFAKVIDAIDAMVSGFGGLQSILLLVSSIALNKFGPSLTNGINEGLKSIMNLKLKIPDIFNFKPATTGSAQLQSNLAQVAVGLNSASSQIQFFNDKLASSASTSLVMSQNMNASAIKKAADESIILSTSFENYLMDTSKVYNLQGLIEQNASKLTAAEKERLSVMQQQVLAAAAQKAEAQATLDIATMALDRTKSKIDGDVFQDKGYYEGVSGGSGQTGVNTLNGTAVQGVMSSMETSFATSNEYATNLLSTWTGFLNELNGTDLALNTINGHLAITSSSTTGLSDGAREAANMYGNVVEVNDDINKILKQQGVSYKEQKVAIQKVINTAQKQGKISKEVADGYRDALKHTRSFDSMSKKITATMAQTEAKANQFAQALGNSKGHLTNIENGVHGVSSAQAQMTEQENQFNQTLEQTVSYLNEIGTKASTIGGMITAGFQGFTTVAMGINSVSNMIKTLGDESAGFGQQMVSVAMGMTMGFNALKTVIAGVGGAINILSANKKGLVAANAALQASETRAAVATAMSTAASELAAGADEAETTATLAGVLASQLGITTKQAEGIATTFVAAAKEGDAAAAAQATVANIGLAASEYAVLWPLLIIAAVIGTVIAAFAIWDAVTVSAAEKTERLTENVENMKDAASEAKEEAEGLKDAFDEYQTVKTTLEECTVGTTEWKEAMEGVKAAIDGILESYPGLAEVADILKWDEDTQSYILDEDKVNNYIKGQEDAANAMSYGAQMAEGVLLEDRASHSSTNFKDAIAFSNYANNYSNNGLNDLNASDLTGDEASDREIIRNAIRNDAIAGNLVDMYQFAATDEYGGYLTNDDGSLQLADPEGYQAALDAYVDSQMYANSELIDSLFSIAETYREINGQAQTIYENVTKAKVSEKFAGQGLTEAEINAASLATKKDYEDIFTDLYGTDGTGDAALAKAFAKGDSDWDSLSEEGKAILTRYEEAVGHAVSWSDNIVQGTDANRTFHITGQEEGLTPEEIATTIAAYEALGGSENPTENQQSSMSVVSSALGSANSVGDALITAITNGGTAEAMTNFLSGLTTDQMNGVLNGIDPETGLLSEEALNALGLTQDQFNQLAEMFGISVQDLSNNLVQAGENVATTTEHLFDNNSKVVQDAMSSGNFGSLALDDQRKVGNALQDAYTYQGTNVMNNLSTVFQNAGEDAGVLADILSGVDWTSDNAVYDLNSALEQQGIKISELGPEWNAYIQHMSNTGDSIYNLIDALDKLRGKMASINEIAGDLEFGSVISDEDYETLLSYNKEIADMFTMTTEGWKFIGDVDQLNSMLETSVADVGKFKEEFAAAQNAGDVITNFATGWQMEDGSFQIGGDYMKTDQQKALAMNTFLNEEAFGEGTFDPIIEASGYSREALSDAISTVANATEADKTTEAYTNALAIVESFYGTAQGFMDDYAAGKFEETTAEELWVNNQISSIEQLQQALNDGSISLETYNKMFDSIAQQEVVDLGFDPKVYKGVKEQILAVNEELVNQKELLHKLTVSQMRAERGSKKMTDRQKDWQKIIENGNDTSTDYVETINEMREAYGDVFDLDPSTVEKLGEDFLTNSHNMDLMTKALAGNDTAWDEWKLAVANAIMTDDIQNQVSGLTDGVFDQVMQDIAEFNFEAEGIEIGASVEDTAFWQALDGMKIGSAEAAQAISEGLSSMGVDAKIIKHVQYADGSTQSYTASGDWFDPATGEITPVDATVEESRGEATYTWYTLEGATYNGKGVSPPSGGDGGKGGGGGGSKPKKAERKKKTDVVDRYKEITDSLDDNAKAMDNASKAADGLYGAARIKNMEKVNQLMQQELTLLNRKRAEAARYLVEDKDALEQAASEAGITFTFDADGDVTNYTDQMTKLYDDYNAAVDAANADGNVTEEEQEALDKLEEKINNVTEALEQYEETKAAFTEIDQTQIDKFNEILQNNFDRINAQIELDIELNEADLKLIEFYLSKMEEDVFAQAEAAALTSGKLETYNDNLTTYLNGYEALNQAYQRGEITSQAYAEGMLSISDGMLEQLGNIQELDTAMKEYYGNTIDMAQEKLSIYTEMMENASAVLDHYNSLMESFGLANNYELMGTVLQAQADVAEDVYETSKKSYEMFAAEAAARKAAYDEAVAAGTTGYALEVLEQQWIDAEAAAAEAQDQMLADAATFAEQLRAVLENSLGKFAQQLEDALTGEFGSFESLTTEMERASSLQEEYLTSTNKIYETNKLMRTAQKEIDKTTNSMAKQKLKQFITETAAMQDQGKLSQYELEIQQAKYDLLLAEIALREAQNAKSTVRLQRDSEGNFGYVYTADQSAIEDAQQKFDDAQNALYNKGLDGANNYAQKYQETMSEMYDTLGEIQQKYLDGEYQSEAEYEAAMEAARSYYYQQLQNYSSLYQTALTTDSRVVADAWSSDFGDMTTQTEHWMSNVDTYIGQVRNAFSGWEGQMSKLRGETVGKDLTELTKKTSDLTKKSDELKNKLAGKDGLIDALGKELEAVVNVTNAYIEQRKAMDEIIAAGETIAQQAVNNAEKTATNEADIAPGSQVTVDEGVSGWNTDVGTADDFGGTVTGGQGYTVIRWDTNREHVLISDGAGNYGWINTTDLVGFDSGGYTGEWGPYGKLAMLHEKEMVLNQEDTSNLLASMEFLNHILEMIDLQAMSAQIGGALLTPAMTNMGSNVIEQDVHIEAHFPNATDHNEIEEAFNNLINTASQYANRK